MMNEQKGEMTWKPNGVTVDVLHLRIAPSQEWLSYTEFPEYAIPDPPGFSQGYATFLALLKQNWKLI